MLPLRRPTEDELWAELCRLPEGMKGEIIGGELHVHPRARPRHQRAAGEVFGELRSGLRQRDHDGGWLILVEPGIELPGAREVAPDVAGWHGEKAKQIDPDEPIRLVPDWVCEVRSPSNWRWDRDKKFPFYARVGVPWLWAIEPQERRLDVLRLRDGDWSLVATLGTETFARIAPFEEVAIDVSRLWI